MPTFVTECLQKPRLFFRQAVEMYFSSVLLLRSCGWLCQARSTGMKEVASFLETSAEEIEKRPAGQRQVIFHLSLSKELVWTAMTHPISLQICVISLALTALVQTSPVVPLGPGINGFCALNKEVLIWKPFSDSKQTMSQSYKRTDFPPTLSILHPS